jgi:LysM repeat protein
MRKYLLLLLVLLVALMAGCQRPKPTVILPQATEPVSTPTTAPQVTETPLSASPTPTATLVATPTPSPTATPQVAVHIVSFGETLFSIAQAYGVSWEALAEANGLSYPYWIYEGQELVIPQVGEVTPVAGQVYVVEYGDTLFSIAQVYGISVEVLAEANGLTYPYTIYVGQQLVIPLEGTPQSTPTGQIYIVQYGDTLYSIAQAYGTTVEVLAEANGLTYPYIIYVGQRMVIP